MHMLEHRHIANQSVSIFFPNLTERLHEDTSRSHRPQQSKSPVTTKRNEMQITFAVIAFDVLRHEEEKKVIIEEDERINKKKKIKKKKKEEEKKIKKK